MKRKEKDKTWNVTFYRAPIHEESSVRAKTGTDAAKKLMDVLQDVTVVDVWEIRETE